MPQRKNKAQDVEATRSDADKIAGLLAFDAMIELVQTKRKFFWLNLSAGLLRGVGAVLGAALAIVLLGYIVSLLGGLPLLGSFLRDIQQNVPAN
jgi:hypothetical protein